LGKGGEACDRASLPVRGGESTTREHESARRAPPDTYTRPDTRTRGRATYLHRIWVCPKYTAPWRRLTMSCVCRYRMFGKETRNEEWLHRPVEIEERELILLVITIAYRSTFARV
jgi:hypothetical protein